MKEVRWLLVVGREVKPTEGDNGVRKSTRGMITTEGLNRSRLQLLPSFTTTATAACYHAC